MRRQKEKRTNEQKQSINPLSPRRTQKQQVPEDM